jgi:ankyrin repeat protein
MDLMFSRQQFDGRMVLAVGLLALFCFCTTPAYTSDNIEQLIKACSRGKIEEARRLIDQGADVNGRDKAGDTPLTTAVRRGKAEIVELLLAKGADPNLKDGLGDPPLYTAVKTWKKIAIAKSLLDRGADPNLAGQMGNTPLIEVARWGETNLVTFLLKHGADPNKKGHLGATPLIAACITTSAGRTPTLKALIDGGADVTLKDQFGFTALTVAKRNKNEELVKFLTEQGVKE